MIDIWNWMVGLGIFSVIAAIFLGLTWRGKTFKGLSTGTKNLALVGAALFLVAGMTGLGVFSVTSESTQTIAGEDVVASYSIGAISESEAELVGISGSDNFEQRVDHNGTGSWDLFEANTQWFVFNVTLTGSGQSQVKLTDPGSFLVTNGANANNGELLTSLVGLDQNGDYDITYTYNSGEFTNAAVVDGSEINFPRHKDHTDGYVQVNVTLNSKIPAYMDTVGDTGIISFDFCGNPVDITVRVNNAS